MFAAFLMLALMPPQDVVAEDAIVVRGTRKKCRMEIAKHLIDDAEFKARAAEWAAGKPVKVLVPPATNYKCLAKIMFKLNDHGVTRAAFVDIPAE
jgi:hypothetical protein